MDKKCMYCKHWQQHACRAMPSQTSKGKYTLVGSGNCRHPSHKEYGNGIPANYSCADFTKTTPEQP